MSVQAMTWARGRAPTPVAQLILFGLADRADPCGVTYVGQDTLARDCSCGVRTVRDNLARLEREQLIARLRRHNARGYRTSDWIILAPGAHRLPMENISDDDVDYGRYPAEVAELARDARDRNPFLAADHAGRPGDLAADAAGGWTCPPADEVAPTGSSLHAYRQMTPALPAAPAGEQLEEPEGEPEGDPTAALPAADERTPTEAEPDTDPDAALWAEFLTWHQDHPRLHVMDAWARFTLERREAA